MNNVDVFSARDLRNRAGGLLKDAEDGKFSVITKHGRPAAIAMPFDALLLELGAHRHLAVRLYAQRLLTLAQAAKLAGLPIEQFLEVLGVSGVNVVDYPAKEVRAETRGGRRRPLDWLGHHRRTVLAPKAFPNRPDSPGRGDGTVPGQPHAWRRRARLCA